MQGYENVSVFSPRAGGETRSKCGSRGGTGGPDPPGKSQVIGVSI